MSTVQASTRKRFPRLSSNAFEHPLDLAALEVVRKIPFVDKIVKKVIELGFERRFRVEMLGRAVHVTPTQCPRIYKLLREACDILDMHEPDLFLINHFTVNAWTFGAERPFIVLHSELIDLLDDDQLLGVIGHELGHVKAGHVLYKVIVFILMDLLGIFKAAMANPLLRIGLIAALMDWSRKSELTADRAELLVVQDQKVCISTHMKMAAGTKRLYEELDTEEFLKQGEKYEALDYDLLNKFYKFFFEFELSHPLPVYRAKELKDWAESKQFEEILAGRYPTKDDDLGLRDCVHCGAKVSPTFFFCPDCGKNARM